MSARIAPQGAVEMLRVSDVAPDPSNARRTGLGMASAMAQLADSIRAKGVLKPLIVRGLPGSSGYQLRRAAPR